MKSAFIRVFGAFLILLLLVLGIGMILPRDYDIRSQVEIDAPAEEVFARINSLPEWRSWSPWNSSDLTGLGIRYSGEESGTGSVQTWSDPRGEGKLWLTESTPHESVSYSMEFANFPKLDGNFNLAQSGDKTTVTWSSTGTLPSGPFYGFFAGMFTNGMKTEYDKGLARLKEVCEAAGADQSGD
ncbi:MAG: SRPBCC family protein [Planctomycetota bacterium]